MKRSMNSFGTLRTVRLGEREYAIHLLGALESRLEKPLASLPYCKRVFVENLLRHEDGEAVTAEDILALANHSGSEREIAFHPSRVLMPDSSGVPLLVDLASLRERVVELGGDARWVNPSIPVDVVVDHSITTEHAGTSDALVRNMAIEYQRNDERYRLIKWAQAAFDGLRIVPPGNGILHQVNLEFLAQVVSTREHGGVTMAFPDSLVGLDSHTPMINGLGVIGWGVGGIEAASAMLGEGINMLVPPVVGCRLLGKRRPGTTSTDIVLALTQAFRRLGVVGKFVEFCGPGLDALTLPDRATIANMAPEYGATMGYFPIDACNIQFLRDTGRAPDHVNLVEAYARLQGLWRSGPEPDYDTLFEFDLGQVGASLSGPSRPDQRVDLAQAGAGFRQIFLKDAPTAAAAIPATAGVRDGDVVIAAITSCTNTSNPSVMVAAGLLARNAVRAGLRPKPWVKTSLAPGSRRVTEYLQASGLDTSLDTLGFQTVGYGCMTCMGGAGDLNPGVRAAVEANRTAAVAVLSGNRNFEARVHPAVRANYLASPPLVVAYALAGTILVDLTREPLGTDPAGAPVFLHELWPEDAEVAEVVRRCVRPALFSDGYAGAFAGDATWKAIGTGGGLTLPWDAGSTYIRRAPYGDAMGTRIDPDGSLQGARILAMLGDDVTTDHISPVGTTAADSAVGHYLIDHGVHPRDFNLLLARRGNPDVVARTAFANVRLRNEIVPGTEGGVTRHQPGGAQMNIFDAATRYREEGVPLVVVAGRNYGAGSSRDTAAKGTALLGVRAIIAESFERIHRSNLVGMGVLPLQFPPGVSRRTLVLDGSERVDLPQTPGARRPGMDIPCHFTRQDGQELEVTLTLRVDTPREMRWVEAGGILAFAGNELLQRHGWSAAAAAR